MAITIRPATNQRNIAPGIENSRVQLNPAGLEAEARGLGQMAGGLQKLGLAIEQKEEDDDTSRLLLANNEIARRVGVLKNDLVEKRKLGQAEGVTADFAAEARKIRNEVYAASGIKYKKTQERFELQSERQLIADEELLTRYERGQKEESVKLLLGESINALSGLVQNGGGNIDDLKAALRAAESDIMNKSGYLGGEESARLIARNERTKLAITAASVHLANNNFDGADEALTAAGEDVDNAMIAGARLKITQNKKDDQLDAAANRVIQTGKTAEAVLSEMGGGNLPYDESNLVFQPGISLEGLNENSKYGVASAFNYAQSLGIPTVQISSTVRSPERNAAVGGVPNSAHQGDSAGDIVLLDESGNALPKSDPRVQKTIANAKADGWTEVLYHDVGSGLHLHLGGYKGKGASSGGIANNRENAEAVNTLVTQKRSAAKRDELLAVSSYIDQMDSELFSIFTNKAMSASERLTAIDRASRAFIPDGTQANSPALFDAATKQRAYWLTQGGGLGVTMSDAEMTQMKRRIALGEFPDALTLDGDLTEMNLNHIQRAELVKEMGKKSNGEGIYGIGWAAIQKDALALSGMDKESPNYNTISAAALDWTKREVEAMKKKSPAGQYPSAMEITKIFQANLTQSAILNADASRRVEVPGHTDAAAYAAGIIPSSVTLEDDGTVKFQRVSGMVEQVSQRRFGQILAGENLIDEIGFDGVESINYDGMVD